MSFEPKQALSRLIAGESLTESEASALLELMAAGELAPALAGALLAALRAKGESADEIRGFARAMRRLAIDPGLPDGPAHVDIVGTGGDGSGSLNLSTGSALLAAAAGLEVVKHGNRSVTSQSGSADVLAALGLPVPLDAGAAARCLEATGFTFLFAPQYHPAMKQIGPVRVALGVPTVFNVLGPLVNPAQPPYSVIGAASEAVASLMADALAGLPIRRAFVIHGAAGWDEATPIGPFSLYDVGPGSVERTTRDPAELGIERCTEADLHGGDAAENAARLALALAGSDTRPHIDALVIGAGLALEVTGRVGDFAAGIDAARRAIDDGRAARVLEKLDAFAAGEAQ